MSFASPIRAAITRLIWPGVLASFVIAFAQAIAPGYDPRLALLVLTVISGAAALAVAGSTPQA